MAKRFPHGLYVVVYVKLFIRCLLFSKLTLGQMDSGNNSQRKRCQHRVAQKRRSAF